MEAEPYDELLLQLHAQLAAHITSEGLEDAAPPARAASLLQPETIVMEILPRGAG